MGFVFAIVGALGFSAKSIIVKFGYRYGVDPITLMVLRMLLALPFFLVLAWWSGRKAVRLTRRDWFFMVQLGFFGYYLSSLLDFIGLQYITVSLERLLLYLNPTFVLLLSWLIWRKTVTRYQLLAMAVSYGGIALVFGHEVGFSGSDGVWGSVLVFASAMSYALYLVVSGHLVKRIGALRLVSLASVFACFFTVCHYLVFYSVAELVVLPAGLWWLSLFNATFSTVAPVVLVMLAIERLGAGLTAQVGMVGPISTMLMGVLLLGEPFNVWLLAGSVLVIAGVLMTTRIKPATA